MRRLARANAKPGAAQRAQAQRAAAPVRQREARRPQVAGRRRRQGGHLGGAEVLEPGLAPQPQTAGGIEAQVEDRERHAETLRAVSDDPEQRAGARHVRPHAAVGRLSDLLRDVVHRPRRRQPHNAAVRRDPADRGPGERQPRREPERAIGTRPATRTASPAARPGPRASRSAASPRRRGSRRARGGSRRPTSDREPSARAAMKMPKHPVRPLVGAGQRDGVPHSPCRRARPGRSARASG